MKNRTIKSQSVRGIFGDKWLLKIEKKAFGWHYWSLTTEDEQALEISNNGKVSISHKYIKWLEFRRHSPYSSNFLFNLLEFIDKIISAIRRILAPFIVPVLVITLIIAAIISSGADIEGNGLYIFDAWLAGIYYGGLCGGTLVLSLLGHICKKAFQIEEKLSAELIADGYSGDVSNCRMQGED